jgi:hypothetical protein
MSQNVNRSVLFNTSAASDVQYSGGNVTIPGLSAIPTNRIINFSQINYRAEIVQVITVGGSLYTPTASTAYTVLIGDSNRRSQGYTEPFKKYSYTTPPVITTLGATAALQREAITAALVAKINAASTYNFVTAASLTGGAGFTITDAAGYYPYPHQGMNIRQGATRVVLASNADGTGFVSTDFVVTTAAVYSVGVGLDLANNAPIMDFMTGNVISGTVDAPKTITGAAAVAGQKYNAFSITYLDNDTIAGITGTTGLSVKQRIIWVDNGAGASVVNLAGYLAFEKEIHRLIGIVYGQDPNATLEFFDKNFLIQGPLGAVVATTTSLKNKFISPYGLLNHYNIGAQTIVAPTQGATGLLIEQDATATEGAHYCPEVATACPQQFVVGKTPMTIVNKFAVTTVANAVYMVGFRSKEAFNVDFNAYNDLVAIGTGAAGTAVATYGVLANAATVTTTSATNLVSNAVNTAVVEVAANGVVSVFMNDVKYPVYSAGTTPLVFAAGTVLIPFFQYTNLNSAAAVINEVEFEAVATDTLYNY